MRQSGVLSSFAQFATDNLASWLRLAGPLTSDAGLAEDLVQEVLVKLHTRWDQMTTVAAPQAYLHRMITNEYLSWTTSTRHHHTPYSAQVVRRSLEFTPSHRGQVTLTEPVLLVVGSLVLLVGLLRP